jgi:hypothetical protein
VPRTIRPYHLFLSPDFARIPLIFAIYLARSQLSKAVEVRLRSGFACGAECPYNGGEVPRSLHAWPKRGITADTAARLGRYFGTSPQYWLNIQNRFDLDSLDKAVIERDVIPKKAA